MAGSIVPISPAAVLVPMLVQAFVIGAGAQTCRRRGVGRLRAELDAMGGVPTIQAASAMLARCCKACGGCTMKDR